jgi:hypothetical protein
MPAKRSGEPLGKPKKKFGRFQLLAGRHCEIGCDGHEYTYTKGEKFDSPANLLKHNEPGQRPKFRRMDDSVPDDAPEGGQADDVLDDMTIPQLRQLAEDDEIDLEGATLKAEIVAKIRAARG